MGDRKLNFLDRCTPAKIGTVPMMVYVHAYDKRQMAPGRWARIKYYENGNWARVLVTRVDRDGYFMADQ